MQLRHLRPTIIPAGIDETCANREVNMNPSLRGSYDIERKGIEFYIDAAVPCTNPVARRTLFSLAIEEVRHMMKIDEIALELDRSGAWPAQDEAGAPSALESSVREIFEQATTELLEKDDRDNAKVIKRAMEFERKTYDIYADLRKGATDAHEQEFFARMMAQEEAHYEALENVYHYLDHTGDWFEREESKAWGWMNT